MFFDLRHRSVLTAYPLFHHNARLKLDFYFILIDDLDALNQPPDEVIIELPLKELEECNYNMIDNVLNNEKPKEEKEKQSGRISIKEKLAEKKEVTRQRDKAEREVPEKGTEKKSEREI